MGDFTLIPLMDRIIYHFLDNLNQKPSAYGVSYIKEIENHYPTYPTYAYDLVVDGKIIRMTIYSEDIDVVDYEEYWWMQNRIILEGEEKITSEMLNGIKRFVGEQNLDKLVEEASQELRKGKISHLNEEMRKFYYL